VISPTRNAVAPNPFNMNPPSPARTTGSGFDQQLSQALSESLARLGVAPGDVNIRITNSGTSARQILITYNTVEPAAAAGPETSPAPAADSRTSTTTAETGARTPATGTPWASWDGPRDRRDDIPAGGGRLTASGAPLIELNERPAGNQYGYIGLAALNPYFTTPSNPNRAGYVLGFQNWFRDAQILGGKSGPVPANKLYYSTEEGAQEALRLVRQHEPGAELTQFQWGGGPFSASNAMYYVKLPGERMMNAGLILNGYYNGGEGVTISSDDDLARSVRSA
jgi:hypothetical protein